MVSKTIDVIRLRSALVSKWMFADPHDLHGCDSTRTTHGFSLLCTFSISSVDKITDIEDVVFDVTDNGEFSTVLNAKDGARTPLYWMVAPQDVADTLASDFLVRLHLDTPANMQALQRLHEGHADTNSMLSFLLNAAPTQIDPGWPGEGSSSADQ